MTQPVWNTSAGLLGTFPALVPISVQLSATPIAPADTLSYKIISGSLSPGLSMSIDGLISGMPQRVSRDITSTFVVRVTDNLDNIRDRTFSIEISGTAFPRLTTPAGSLASILDSRWLELQIESSNPIESNPTRIRLVQGTLPPGLEINDKGLIRGYAEPPILRTNLSALSATAVATSSNAIICNSTIGFTTGRPVVFSGTVFGGVVAGDTYYIRSIINESSFTISQTSGGPEFTLENAIGDMNITLPSVSFGQPTIQTFSFSLRLESPLGNDVQSYSITVINQNTSPQRGGPGFPRNTRTPTIYNTRPPTYAIENLTDFGYFVLPSDRGGFTFTPDEFARIGRISSDNYFSFRILGNDFDGNSLEYVYLNLPLGLVGDTDTGWITGTPIIADDSINEFSFGVFARKRANPNISTPVFNFSFKISQGIDGRIEWITPTVLEEVFNGSISTDKVEAVSDVALEYRLISGELPPNLTLDVNGEISGTVAYQPDTVLQPAGSTVPFEFTVEAFSPRFPVLREQKTFVMNVLIKYTQPTETLYIKCTPNIKDRDLIKSLLTSSELIPDEYLYRPTDPNFGKANAVIYAHAFGIFASEFNEYVDAITKNHYWKQLTLGEIKTAIARDNSGEILYEVVYSQINDNLVNLQGKSVSKEIFWPRPINLNQGPWYTSTTSIYTSYGEVNNVPTYYTSLTTGPTRFLYPNSLENMRDQVGDTLGRLFDFNLLPKWMSSQQLDGSTLGYTPAWVIAYTKPGFAETIKNNIENNWVDVLGDNYRLNEINFKIDRFTVDKSSTFNFDKGLVPAAWTGLPSGSPIPDPKESKDFYVLFPQKTIL